MRPHASPHPVSTLLLAILLLLAAGAATPAAEASAPLQNTGDVRAQDDHVPDLDGHAPVCFDPDRTPPLYYDPAACD